MRIYITTEFDISKISFRVYPTEWNVCLLGETDHSATKNIPGYQMVNGRDTWTVELSIDNGRIHNWPHGLEAEVSLYDPDGVYMLEDDTGNSITYVGAPPKCFRILDDTDMSFAINGEGFIEDWKISIDLLEEWGTTAEFKGTI